MVATRAADLPARRGGCIGTIIGEDHPTIRAVNPRTYIRDTDYVDRPFRTSLGEFARQRTELVAVLEPLPSDGWARHATITGAGVPLVRSVRGYAEWLATHERAHWRQFRKIVGLLT